MLPFLSKIQEQGHDIEFAYARTATPESYSEERHFIIALLKNRADSSYCLKYYICKWRESSTRAEDQFLLNEPQRASLLAERANKVYSSNDVQRREGFDGYMCYFYQKNQVVYSWWGACPDRWVEMENIVKELINEIPYPTPLHKVDFVAVRQGKE